MRAGELSVLSTDTIASNKKILPKSIYFVLKGGSAGAVKSTNGTLLPSQLAFDLTRTKNTIVYSNEESQCMTMFEYMEKHNITECTCHKAFKPGSTKLEMDGAYGFVANDKHVGGAIALAKGMVEVHFVWVVKTKGTKCVPNGVALVGKKQVVVPCDTGVLLLK